MSDPQAWVVPWTVGFLSGLVAAVPVGPINVTIVNEAARRGFVTAFAIGLGAGVMEMIYCFAGFAGFAELFKAKFIQAAFQLVGFIVMIALGWHYYTARTLPGRSRSEEAVERRFHPHTAFMIGFLRVLGNPGVLLFWIAASATFTAHSWVRPNWTSKGVCLAGVAVATFAWFALLSWFAARAHGRFSTDALLRLSRISGACLLLVAVVLGIRIILLLMRA
jgi:threonine/homoserine/homoserine lactone efflux protein